MPIVHLLPHFVWPFASQALTVGANHTWVHNWVNKNFFQFRFFWKVMFFIALKRFVKKVVSLSTFKDDPTCINNTMVTSLYMKRCQFKIRHLFIDWEATLKSWKYMWRPRHLKIHKNQNVTKVWTCNHILHCTWLHQARLKSL